MCLTARKRIQRTSFYIKGKNNAFVVAASIAGLAIGAVVSSMLAVRYLRRSQYTTISGLVRDLYGTKTKIEEPKIEEFKVKKNVKSKRKT